MPDRFLKPDKYTSCSARLVALVLCGVVFESFAGGLKSIDASGFIGIESRRFFQDPAYPGQLSGSQYSVYLEPAFEWQSEDRRHQAGFVPFARLDAEDEERSQGDIREAYWRYFSGDWDLSIGIDRVFWGVTEARHLVNIINQVDAVENIDQEDFLGQPMLHAGLQKDYGKFELWILPYFRERTFPGVEGRLRGPLVVNTDHPQYESSRENSNVDVAVRYSHSFGSWDMGWSLFHGTGREPSLIPDASARELIPFYQIITQAGLDLQFTTAAWLWKFEAIGRKGQGDTFGALVGGFEYTFYQVFNTDRDIGLLLEYLYDDRDQTAPRSTFQNDLFFGSRVAFNDIQDTAILGGIIHDTQDQSNGLRLEIERRLGQSWKLELEGQLFTNVADSNAAAAIARDDLIMLSIKKYW